MREEMKFSDEAPAQEQKQICMSQATFLSLRPSQHSESCGVGFLEHQALSKNSFARAGGLAKHGMPSPREQDSC